LRILAFAAVVEASTGLVLVVAPAVVAKLLLGAELDHTAVLLARCFGIALLALALACWPDRQPQEGWSSAFRAVLTYNALIAMYLAYVGAVEHSGGLLLWPAVALHAGVAVGLALTKRSDTR